VQALLDSSGAVKFVKAACVQYAVSLNDVILMFTFPYWVIRHSVCFF